MSKRRVNQKDEVTSVYFLKLLLYIVLGSLWIRFGRVDEHIGLPVGLGIGLIFASHEHFQMDKKIELAVLLIVTIITYFLPAGILLQF